MRGIQRRWMLNNLGMVTLILLALVASVMFVTANSYYSTMRMSLETRASVDANSISIYRTRSEYIKAARSYVESFQDGAKIEVQYLSNGGSVTCSSYSLTIAGSQASTPDATWAQSSRTPEYWMGKDAETGERVLSVTSPLIYKDRKSVV